MKKSSENSMLPERGQEWIPRSLSPFSRRKDTCTTFLLAQSFAGRPLVTLLPHSPDVHREFLSIYVTENVVVVELRIRGTHKGELALGSKTIAPTGMAID